MYTVQAELSKMHKLGTLRHNAATNYYYPNTSAVFFSKDPSIARLFFSVVWTFKSKHWYCFGLLGMLKNNPTSTCLDNFVVIAARQQTWWDKIVHDFNQICSHWPAMSIPMPRMLSTRRFSWKWIELHEYIIYIIYNWGIQGWNHTKAVVPWLQYQKRESAQSPFASPLPFLC